MKRKTIGFMILVMLAFFAPGLAPHVRAQGDDTAPAWTLVDIRLVGDEMWQQISTIYPDSAPLGQDGLVKGRWYQLMLSPDGSTLVGAGFAYKPPDNDQLDSILCRYEIDSREVICVPFDARRIPWLSPLDAAWSPDGTRIALHEDMYHKAMEDSDIWLLDVATLTLTNATDDGQTGNWFKVPHENILVDNAPMWSADGDLYFFRMAPLGSSLTTALYRLPGGTGTPEHILDLPGDLATFQVTDLARVSMAPGSTASDLRIALIPMRTEFPMMLGLWTIEIVAGKAALPLAASLPDLQAGSAPWSDLSTAPLVWGALQLAWNADGTRLAVHMRSWMGEYSPGSEQYKPDAMNYVIVDPQTNAVMPIFDFAALSGYDELAGIEATLPGLGMIAPDRQGFIYVAQGDGDPRTLWAASFDSGEISPVSGTLPEEIYKHLYFYSRSGTVNGYWGQSSASGRILYGDVLLTFEQ